MKAIEVKNPLFILAIGKFVTAAIEMEQYLDMMIQVAPDEKKKLVQDLSDVVESMVPIIEKLKANEIPPELEAFIKTAKEKGINPTLLSGIPAKTDEPSEEQEEEMIDNLLDSVNKKYK